MDARFNTGAMHSGIDAQPPAAAAWAAMPHILFGLRLWASVSLALLAAYWLQLDNAYWAGTSASIVAQPGLGASLRKGRYRAIGTILGALVIVMLTAVFPQSHPGFLFSLTLWGAICGLFATILPNFAGYGAALAGYTAAVVFANVVDDPNQVFQVAVARTIEIGIGIFSAGLVHALTDFGDARRRLRCALADIGRDIAAGLRQTLAAEPQLPARAQRRPRVPLRMQPSRDGLQFHARRKAPSNLIDNAIKYGTTPELGLARDQAAWSISIKDRGPGIPAEALVSVFRPYHRLDKARNRGTTGGVGLGLTVAQAIVHGHGGKIVLSNRAGGGLEARISLPIDAAHPRAEVSA
jgi:hypothetical protein